MHRTPGILIFAACFYLQAFSQPQTIQVKQLVWGPDYQIYLQLSNDSVFQYDFDQLIMANPDEAFDRPTRFIFYPVTFDMNYIDSLLTLKNKKDYTANQPNSGTRRVSLWGSVREEIGGGWVHFINCLLFALETRQLTLDAPIFIRPQSNWKPNPVTETWLRTHRWKYYVPVEHKYALKEYKIRKKKKQLAEIESLPKSYLNAFLHTSDRRYRQLLKKGDYKTLARVDLVKLLLGAQYLGDPQIEYIKSRILQAIQNYNAQYRPSVLIFDKYNAAVVVTLDGLGYKAQKIVFRDEDSISPEQRMQRINIIRGIIELINVSNNEAFKQRLGNMYNM
ncbi:MAG TPA: hypothetical protein PLF75_10420 [Bacteroidales bacterium]|nr:hypothetical protein [Bacteroidales bacterium]